ncbi:hypothetical protein Tco_0301636 [Tanacetum coccineum]
MQHSKLNANSELKCVKCNGCMLSDNHDVQNLNLLRNKEREKFENQQERCLPLLDIFGDLLVEPSLSNSKTNVPVSKSKVLQSVSANKKKPSKS